MFNRREFLTRLQWPAAALVVGAILKPNRVARALEVITNYTGSVAESTMDDAFWFQVRQAYAVDRSLTNLNNGGVSPSSNAVLKSLYEFWDYSNKAPVYTMWRILEPQRETVRSRVADLFHCDPEEIALTRNTSEGMETCQLGLPLKAGDEVLTTNQDYPRMLTTWQQRERRDGIVLKQFSIPTPAENPAEIVNLFEQHITPRTRVLLISHINFTTGQIMPVKAVVAMARQRGIITLVDGAHSFAHLAFNQTDLDCDYFATSLHKWLGAPHGTGMLFVRKNKIAEIWPLMAAPKEMDQNIRKFEEIGTHPAATFLAIADALNFYQGIGAQRKEARLRFLRDRWAQRLVPFEQVKFHTSLKPEFACGLTTVQIKGVDSGKLVNYLWEKHRILVTGISHPEFEGIRVSPNVYTSLEEIDRFGDVMECIIKNGLPK
ncbi:aminotransferase class V-fold PLP-dependent enzyme [candidate division KSB1 bacterium]|nr:aminotransferase class V-fold PLP-dependent enzyme [candidate division KSB1 bacterium]